MTEYYKRGNGIRSRSRGDREKVPMTSFQSLLASLVSKYRAGYVAQKGLAFSPLPIPLLYKQTS